VLPYLLLSRADSAHREHDLRGVFNGVRYIARPILRIEKAAPDASYDYQTQESL
jgi:hypothetical protein